MDRESPPFGQLLRAYRKRSNLTIADVAAMVGLSREMLIQLEYGTRLPRPGLVRLLATSLQLTGDELDAFLASAVPEQATTPRIFVSHSHQDNEFTTQFVADLRKAGASVWVDTSNIHDGDFVSRINEALAQSDWVVVVLSSDALRSPAVQHEVNAAIALVWSKQLRGVIPVLARPCDPDSLPPTWRVFHFFDASANYDEALKELLTSLKLIA